MKKVLVTASILLVVVVVYKVYMGLLQSSDKLKSYTWLQLVTVGYS